MDGSLGRLDVGCGLLVWFSEFDFGALIAGCWICWGDGLSEG